MRCGASIAGAAPHAPGCRQQGPEESVLSRLGRSHLVDPVLDRREALVEEGLTLMPVDFLSRPTRLPRPGAASPAVTGAAEAPGR
jgi:hypothetical protein